MSASETAWDLVGIAQAEDIASMVKQRVKQLGNSWMGSNGICLSMIQDLSIPRNSQDTFIISLDQTFRHHDSAQLVINAAHHSIIPSESDQTVQPSCFMSIKQCLIIFFFWSWSHFIMTSLLFSPFLFHDPHASLLLSLTPLFKSESPFLFYWIPWLSLHMLISNLPLYLFGSLLGALVGTNT